jgi:hypothetical protein
LIHWDMQLAYRRPPARFVEFQQTAKRTLANFATIVSNGHATEVQCLHSLTAAFEDGAYR